MAIYLLKAKIGNIRTMWNLLKVNNEYTKSMPMASFWVFIVNIPHFYGVSIYWNKLMLAG